METQELSTVAVKKLLGCLLNGPAHETYIENRTKSLSEILQCLLDRHGSVLTIHDKMVSLENIKRNSNEKLPSLMTRVSSLIDATRYLTQEHNRETRRELLLIDKLINLCSEKARMAILRERAKAAHSGYILTYKQMFSMANDIENNENKVLDSFFIENHALHT